MSGPRRIVDWPERHFGLALKQPIDLWLEHLLDVADQAGERTNRRELVGALIFGAPGDAVKLRRLLHDHRTAPDTALDLGEQLPANVVLLPARRPGPRPRRPLSRP